MTSATNAAASSRRSRSLYAARVAGLSVASPWWTAIVITAGSRRQAERYEREIERRRQHGQIPADVRYVIAPDPDERRLGSGGATLNGLRALVDESRSAPAEWWSGQRVLMIHAGGDSRSLPQYSLSGKLFSAVPVQRSSGEASTIFDEILALSTAWVEQLPGGLVVASGDVVTSFDPESLDWSHRGVVGIAVLQPAERGTRHGVYITGEDGSVYAYLQKPTIAELRAAGGLLEGDLAALDTGLLCFAPDAAVRLTELACAHQPVPTDLYRHFTMALTGQWKPAPDDPAALRSLADALGGLPFSCVRVAGDFMHVGTTTRLRQFLTEETEFSKVYAVQQRLGAIRQPGLQSAGVVIDSVLSGGDLGPASLVIECNLEGSVNAGPGSVLHGLEGIFGRIEVPEDTVVHQIPVSMPDGRRAMVIRVYGVRDDPQATVSGGQSTWFGRSILEQLRGLGIDAAEVWPGLPAGECSLWNAQLFPATELEEAWACAQWLLGLSRNYPMARWRAATRLSLASSAQWADGGALEASQTRRLKTQWRTLALSIAVSGADIRPLLVHAPGIGPLAETGAVLRAQGERLEESSLTEAASRYYAAGRFFSQAGLAEEAGDTYAAAFRAVERAVQSGGYAPERLATAPWQHDEVVVEGPARIDLGGGWSDTPPFCLDWGGTVLNVAVLLNGLYPIRTMVRRLREPVLRCGADGEESTQYGSCAEILGAPRPGDPLSIHRTALQMTGLFREGTSLGEILERMGGGLEIRTAVDLPMGSGLGTSSILAATLLRALSEMMGLAPDSQTLSDHVMRLEQLMTTGGGWQDQAGGIFPGAKLIVSGPGLRQKLRVQPVPWTPQRAGEFEELTVLFYTGIRRIARDLLQQVVGSYLGRETACIQVLHSIKTLAMEMSYAMQEGDWEHLGELLDRHWELNQVLDPNTTNAPISALLGTARPFIHGAKLAGAGGGGFLILLARSRSAAQELKKSLAESTKGTAGVVYDWRIAEEGLRTGRQ